MNKTPKQFQVVVDRQALSEQCVSIAHELTKRFTDKQPICLLVATPSGMLFSANLISALAGILQMLVFPLTFRRDTCGGVGSQGLTPKDWTVIRSLPEKHMVFVDAVYYSGRTTASVDRLVREKVDTITGCYAIQKGTNGQRYYPSSWAQPIIGMKLTGEYAFKHLCGYGLADKHSKNRALPNVGYWKDCN